MTPALSPDSSCKTERGRALSALVRDTLNSAFSPRRVAYITRVLSQDELSVIRDLRDALIIARIKRMSPRRLQRFDRLIPHDSAGQRFYQTLQCEWLRQEEFLLGTRLGRSPTQKEVFLDFMRHQNGERFRAYFAIKYPMRMRPRTRPAKAGAAAEAIEQPQSI